MLKRLFTGPRVAFKRAATGEAVKRAALLSLTTILTGLTYCLLLSSVVAHAQTTSAFTYQGRLSETGSPANGTYDFEFKLFDASGAQLGAGLTREDVQVTGGVFLIQLDFGVSPFVPGAAASTLEIGVRPGASTATFTTLSPRQPITSSPYSVQTINAEKLGGVDASEYVKTDDPRLGGSGNNSYVQNSTTQQPNVSFNIGGNGLFGGQVGIGTQTPLAGTALDVNGVARVTPGGGGGQSIQFGNPNSETGMTISNPAFGRADLRFDGSSVKLVAGPASGGPPSNFSGIAVQTTGDVTIGAAAITGKLSVVEAGKPALFAQSDNRGLWGKSTGSSYGVYGESVNGIGAQGLSVNNIGLSGLSTSNFGVFGASNGKSGVFGQTAVDGIDPSEAGVKGVAVGSNGIGVRGEGEIGLRGLNPSGHGTGVWGSSTNNNGVVGTTLGGTGVTGGATTGTGVRGESTSGYAMFAAGNVGQTPGKGGFVKAMLRVNPDGTIAACYNSQLPDGGASLPPSGNDGCGFNVHGLDGIPGSYSITTGFTFSFFAVTPGFSGTFAASASASHTIGSSTMVVWIYLDDRRRAFGAFADFTVIIF